MTAEWVLYRVLASDATLLYVGISGDLARRIREHRLRSDWWAAAARVEAEPMPSRAEAAKAERLAIRSEHPVMNVAESYRHNERCRCDRCSIRAAILDRLDARPLFVDVVPRRRGVTL